MYSCVYYILLPLCIIAHSNKTQDLKNMHYYTPRAEKSHGAQTMTSNLGIKWRSAIIKNGDPNRL